jgi:hypothetical protein
MIVSTSANIVTNYKQIVNEPIHIIEIIEQIENEPLIEIKKQIENEP